MFALTNASIADALIAAKNRGVDVALKTDKTQSAGKTQTVMIGRLKQAGIPVEVSTQTRLLHHKFAVIDGRYVLTGSYNWMVSAEQRNRENLVVLDCPEIAQAYEAEWGSIQHIYDLAFLSAFRALEALLGTAQIKNTRLRSAFVRPMLNSAHHFHRIGGKVGTRYFPQDGNDFVLKNC
jgi:phosphatidylserine/phosphatidylglycerophosphate/cardiolipin synthase-like enzyme